LEANGASIDVTRRYYNAIDPMLRDLRRRTMTATDYRERRPGHDSYASSIENMSTRYVDPDMVKFGQTVCHPTACDLGVVARRGGETSTHSIRV